MKASNIPCVALPQDQQDSSDLSSSLNFPQVITEVSPETGKQRFLCSKCRSGFAQSQGAWRHIRTFHKPKEQCSLCEFEYARPYEYDNHLRKKHQIIDTNLILGKVPRSRRRATIRKFKLIPQQPPVSPLAVEDQQNRARSQLCTPTPPSLAGECVTSVSQPAELSGDYNCSQFRLTSAQTGVSTATHSPSTTSAHFEPGDDNHSTIFPEDGSFGLMSSDGDFWGLVVPQIGQGWMRTDEERAGCDPSRDTE